MKLLFRITFWTYVALIIGLSVTPSAGLGKISINDVVYRIDYPLHAFAFFLLPIIGFLANGRNGSKRPWWLFVIISLVLAIGTEYLQFFVQERTFNPIDIYSNLIGLVIGVISVLGYLKFFNPKPNPT